MRVHLRWGALSLGGGVLSSTSIRDGLQEVLELQERYQSDRSLEMDRRGNLIRKLLPSLIQQVVATYLTKPPFVGFDWWVEGRDATGKKARIPWVRVFDKKLSTRATHGWYACYLFDGTGKTVFLALMRGATENTGDQFVPKDSEWLRAQVDRARLALFRAGLAFPNHVNEIDLNAPETRLAKAYAEATVVAKRYEKSNLPVDQDLISDLLLLLQGLTELYKFEKIKANK